jgi:hypothetical protein
MRMAGLRGSVACKALTPRASYHNASSIGTSAYRPLNPLPGCALRPFGGRPVSKFVFNRRSLRKHLCLLVSDLVLGNRLSFPRTRVALREKAHSTVTLFARFRGLSTSVPRAQAVWYASSCSGTTCSSGLSVP